MKIKIFIVTYRNEKALNENLTSLLASDMMKHDWQIHIINNHTIFKVDPAFESIIKVWHNDLRPDFSTGHLSRNWNQAIINGFKDLNNPDCDILVTSQDDVIFKKDTFSQLIALHKKYSFIQAGAGDALCSYLPEAVKKIGLWDERFCNIGYQEADYFLRAFIYNREKSSISDIMHTRLLNELPADTLAIMPPHDNVKADDHAASKMHHTLTGKLFFKKWGIRPERWKKRTKKNPPRKSKILNYILYPYFEKNIELEGKNYFTGEERKKMLISRFFRSEI